MEYKPLEWKCSKYDYMSKNGVYCTFVIYAPPDDSGDCVGHYEYLGEEHEKRGSLVDVCCWAESENANHYQIKSRQRYLDLQDECTVYKEMESKDSPSYIVRLRHRPTGIKIFGICEYDGDMEAMYWGLNLAINETK